MYKPLYTVNGKRGTLEDLCLHFRVAPPKLARERVNKRGWDAERAVMTPPGEQTKKGFEYTKSSN